MSDRLSKLLDAITPWRNKEVEEEREDLTYTEVRKSLVRRKRLQRLNESYRLADLVWEKREK